MPIQEKLKKNISALFHIKVKYYLFLFRKHEVSSRLFQSNLIHIDTFIIFFVSFTLNTTSIHLSTSKCTQANFFPVHKQVQFKYVIKFIWMGFFYYERTVYGGENRVKKPDPRNITKKILFNTRIKRYLCCKNYSY